MLKCDERQTFVRLGMATGTTPNRAFCSKLWSCTLDPKNQKLCFWGNDAQPS